MIHYLCMNREKKQETYTLHYFVNGFPTKNYGVWPLLGTYYSASRPPHI